MTLAPPIDLAPVTCGEWGAPQGERWSDPVALTQADRESAAAWEAAGVLQSRRADSPRAGGRVGLAGTDHVGVLVLPSGRRVWIRPKVGGLALLDWMAYLGESPSVSGWLGESWSDDGDGFVPALAALFLCELATLTRLHLRKGYVRTHFSAPAVRGRVLASGLARACHRLPDLPQSRRLLTLDTPHNALLAAALDRMPLLLPAAGTGDRTGSELRRRWAALAEEWSGVARIEPPAAGATAPPFAPDSPPGYGPALRLARLILAGCSPRLPGTGAAGAPAFLVRVSGVWERALRRMCREASPGSGWTPAPYAQRTRRWHDAPADKFAGAAPRAPGGARWMTADAILRRGESRWVLDAKYKRDFGDEGRDDRFQMAAYAIAFDAARGTLVYPSAAGDLARVRVLLAGEVGGRRVMIDAVDLPMAAGPAVCRRAVGDLIRCNRFGGEPQATVATGPRPVGSE